MTSEMDEMRFLLSEIIYDLLSGDTELDIEGGFHPIADQSDEVADQILSVETDTCRIAVVRKAGELPKNPYPNQYITDLGQTTYDIDKETEAGRIGYMEAQRDMLNAGFVKDVKDE